jgi:hypothetical protein
MTRSRIYAAATYQCIHEWEGSPYVLPAIYQGVIWTLCIKNKVEGTFFILKNKYKYKKDLDNVHAALRWKVFSFIMKNKCNYKKA